MECVDTYVAAGTGFYALFYEERGPGNHLSRVYYAADRSGTTVRLVAELPEWLVSLWADPSAGLFGAAWDGRIFRLVPEVAEFEECDLLGTIKLAGFDGAPRFLMGEDGLIFENRGRAWERVKYRGKPDIYSVARRSPGVFLFPASDGRLVVYREGTTAVTEELPTDADLHGITFVSPERGAVVGEEGVAFLYEDGAWTDITAGTPTFHDVHAFKGRLVVSVEDERIAEIGADGTLVTLLDKPGYYFSSNAEVCVTFNDEAVVIFDGETFTQVPHSGGLGG